LQEIPARKIPIKRGFSKFFRKESKKSRVEEIQSIHKRKDDSDRVMHTYRVRKRENSFDHNKVPSF
jgi:hypothetical protein